MSLCNGCGHENPAHSAFCSRCGHALAPVPGTPAPHAAAPHATAPEVDLPPAVGLPPPAARAPIVRLPFVIMGVAALFVAIAIGSFFALGALTSDNRVSGSDASRIVRDAREHEKVELLQAPSRFLEAKNARHYDKGIINDYRQLVEVTVLNHSSLPVQNISGEIEWLNANGASVGTLPFHLVGSIAAGDTKTFKQESGTLTSGTLQTRAKDARLRFTRVGVVE